MFKYIFILLTIGLDIIQIRAADVEMQVADSRQTASSLITAEKICQGLLADTPLVGFPQELIPEFRMRSWQAATTPAEKASMTASLYYCAVDDLESANPTQDMNQAKAWYAQAALLGDPYALYSLGIIFIKWEKQEALGRILMQAAADKNYYDARVYLGLEKQDF